MNRLEIIKKIHDLTNGKKKQEIHQIEKRLTDEQFENSDKVFYEQWSKIENHIEGEQWHQFVRLAINFEEIEYMFKRMMNLLRRHRRSTDEYFKAKFHTGISELPYRSSELYLLFDLTDEFFQIYRRIENQMNFDRSKITSSDSVHGRINWNKTMLKLKTDFPTHFETDDWKKKFDTPENILLVWTAIWINRRIELLLKIRFTDPLDDLEVRKLIKISDNCKKIISTFPFYDVVNLARKNFGDEIKNNRIQKLEFEIKQRMQEGFIDNSAYANFLQWFTKIKSFNFPEITKKERTVNFLLDATKNIDAMYKIWIFFELLNYFSKHCKINFVLNSDLQYFQFEINHQNLNLFYEKIFEEGEQFAWAQKHVPDFTVLINNEVMAVFDAKNYRDKSNRDDSPKNKILAYMTNLGTGYGAVLWPKNQTESVYPRINSDDSTEYHQNLKLASYSFNPYFELNEQSSVDISSEKILAEIKSRVKPATKCPNCNRVSISAEEIEKFFGFRNMAGGVRPQSWCRECRTHK